MITSSRIAIVLMLLFIASSSVETMAQNLDAIAERGVAIASSDPLALQLRSQQPDDLARRGFDIGMAVAEGHTVPGPGKQIIHDSLSVEEQAGFSCAVTFSLERNRRSGKGHTGQHDDGTGRHRHSGFSK